MEIFFLTLFLVSLLLQAFLLLYLFPKLIHSNPIQHATKTRGVSVIIAANNERKNLERLIPLLLRQNFTDFEIIVALDRSTDLSEEYLKSLADPRLKTVVIQEVPSHFNPKKYALTKAIEKAKKEILLFTDADCYPVSENWIRNMHGAFDEKTEIVLGFSPYEQKKGFLNLFIRFETLLTAVQYLSFALAKNAYMGVGRNMAYLRSLFIKSAGFDNMMHLTGGDDDLFIGKTASGTNVKVCTGADSNMISVPKKTWKEFFNQKIRHQAAGKKYLFKNQVKAALYPLSLIILYFSTIVLDLSNHSICFILSIYIFRTLVFVFYFEVITRNLGETTKWYWLPLLDLSYILYYIITGTVAIFSKNVKWR